MENKAFDVVVIGSGPGGYACAIRAAQLRFKVAIAERMETLGGTCLNLGCIPAKALLDSTELLSLVRDKSEEHGIIAPNVGFDLGKMMARKRAIVERRTRGLLDLMVANGIETVFGDAKIAGRGSVTLISRSGNEEKLSAANIVVATGSAPFELPSLPFDGKSIVSSDEALSFESVPKDLLVVGGGAIGLELGSVWQRLGSRVTVIELLPRIAPGADEETARALSRELYRQGIGIHTSTRVKGFEIKGGRVSLDCEDADGKRATYNGDKALIAVGRKPVTDSLGLDDAGVKVSEKSGRIKTDRRFRTSVEGIYAIGDVIEGPMLAHRASEEGVACAQIIAGLAGELNYGALPSVIYTWPELASCGLTEEECKDRGLAYKKGRFSFKANGRAETSGSNPGFVKILSEAKTDRILGGHIIGPWASDLIGEIVSVIEFGGSSEDIARTIHAHPTFSEAVKEAAMDVEGWSLHALPEKAR